NIAKKACTNSTKVWRNWSVCEKLIVIYYSKGAQNNKVTTRRFDIETKQVVTEKQYPLLERSLVEWIETLRNKQIAVSQKVVVIRAKQFAQTIEIKDAYSNIGDFRFSNTQWVGESWNDINPSIFRKAFKCCSISVATDGSEDDLVFDYKALSEDLKNANEESIRELNINDISSEEYEEAE
ncbi:14045_t:CDS:2, partial [Gigaspora margarita]